MLNRVFGAFSGFSACADMFSWNVIISTASSAPMPFENNENNAETTVNSTRIYALRYRFLQHVSNELTVHTRSFQVRGRRQTSTVTEKKLYYVTTNPVPRNIYILNSAIP